jgi:hypothetical protein
MTVRAGLEGGKVDVANRLHQAGLAAAVAAALALLSSSSVAAVAARDGPKFRLDAGDQKLARSLVPSKSDMESGWKGGLVKLGKADIAPLPCPGYTESGLVFTGLAESHLDFQGAIIVDTDAFVLETKEMVELDTRRLPPTRELPCLKALFESGFTHGERIVSVSRLPEPHGSWSARGYRVVYDWPHQGRTYRETDDLIFLAEDRFEFTVDLSFLYSSRRDVAPVEASLVKLLLESVTAPPLSRSVLAEDDIPGFFERSVGAPYKPGPGLAGYEVLFAPEKGHGNTSLVFVDEQLVHNLKENKAPGGSFGPLAHDVDIQRARGQVLHNLFLATVLLPPDPHLTHVDHLALGDDTYILRYRAATSCCEYWAAVLLVGVGREAAIISIGAVGPIDEKFVRAVARAAAKRLA